MSAATTEQTTTTTSRTAFETTLHMWRTAANVVATDPVESRRKTYEQAITLVMEQLQPYTSVRNLVEQFWWTNLQAVAAVASLQSAGKVLNHQVVAAAACWRRIHQLQTSQSLEAELGAEAGEE